VQLVRRAGGYVLVVGPGLVDLHEARELAVRARAAAGTEQAEQAELLDRALRLWREVPLAGLTGRWVDQTREDLERERLGLCGERIDANLAAGRYAEAGREARALAGEHPLNELFTRQAMLAAYRSGEQAEAFQAFHRLREQLAEELGVDPGPELVELYQQILTAPPAPNTPAPKPPRGTTLPLTRRRSKATAAPSTRVHR